MRSLPLLTTLALAIPSVVLAAAAPVPQVTRPGLVAEPTVDQMKYAYPRHAKFNHIEGQVVLQCQVSQRGSADECQVFSEQPTGWGFGPAALSLAKDFRLKPMLVDGQPVAGAIVRLPVAFYEVDDQAANELNDLPAPAFPARPAN